MTEGITNTSSNGLGNLSSKVSSQSQTSKNEFLKLLTFQLRNQNPLNPYDNQEFATQLAQFSQLEQLTDIKSLLEEQMQTNLLLTQTISYTALPGLIGKSAKALSDKIYYNGEDDAKITFNLQAAGNSGTITIKDEAGRVVRTIDIDESKLSKGEHSMSWDGKDSEGNSLAEGKYTVSVEITDAGGSTYSADTYAVGKIEGVRFKAEGTMMIINGMEIPLQNVSDIMT